MNINIKQAFVQNILLYYRKNKRDLPWRNISDPYKIWISEIILQQTQVKQGLLYYHRFIEKFPTVNHLASASEEDVLHLWQGLGYYSRARNLHRAALQIINDYKGKFPSTYKEILKLKGVGEYTAAAIASFAFNLPYAVLDGNVFRVLARFFGIQIPIDTHQGKNYFKSLAQELLPKENCSEYNQAIMEFGATYCKPKNPDCCNCILNLHCVAYAENQTDILPVKSKSLSKKNRFFNYFIFIEKNNYVYIQKRTSQDIWKGLYEFYLLETTGSFFNQTNMKEHLLKRGIKFNTIDVLHREKHILTHQNLNIQFVLVDCNQLNNIPEMKRIRINQLYNYPFPIVIRKFIDNKIMLIKPSF